MGREIREIGELTFTPEGLIPAIVQDADAGDVLMLAWMNRESLAKTLASGQTHFWSRSRGELWHKGATSGGTQRVRRIFYDCDGDALLVQVEQAGGGACHEGARSCFHYGLSGEGAGTRAADAEPETGMGLGRILGEVDAVIESRREEMPENSYTTYLFREGVDKILKKVGEESAETIIAAKNGDPEALAAEVSDLLYHLLVLLRERGVPLSRVARELEGRR